MAATQRWDYKTVDVKPGFFGARPEQVQDELDKHGKQGWELVSALSQSPRNNVMLIFKRPA